MITTGLSTSLDSDVVFSSTAALAQSKAKALEKLEFTEIESDEPTAAIRSQSGATSPV